MRNSELEKLFFFTLIALNINVPVLPKNHDISFPDPLAPDKFEDKTENCESCSSQAFHQPCNILWKTTPSRAISIQSMQKTVFPSISFIPTPSMTFKQMINEFIRYLNQTKRFEFSSSSWQIQNKTSRPYQISYILRLF